jgi:gliding motility-associated transport system ATP-binding protein
VLSGVSFSVDAGELVGFIGPNGAGKTTTLRIASGYLSADAGRVVVAGHDVARQRDASRRSIGYLQEGVAVYPEMRIDEYLAFRARLKGVRRRDAARRIDAVCEAADLVPRRRELIGRLSRGYRQRVGIADALLAEPPVLLLDEPTTGLDPVQLRELRELLRGLAGRHTILISSHALSEIGALASRFVVLHRGVVVADGTAAQLRDRVGLGEDAGLEEVFVALLGEAD